VRLHEIICEGRDAPLYHATTLSAAIRILYSGGIQNYNDRETDDGKPMVSLTRDRRLRYYSREGITDSGIAPVQFVLDQRKLTQRFEIKPFDYWDSAQRNPRNYSKYPSGHESEEQVITDFIPLSYVSAIELLPLPDDFRDRSHEDDEENMRGKKLTGYRELKQLARKNGIRVIDRRTIREYYREEPLGNFTHDGTDYYLNPILERSAALPVEQFLVRDLDWIIDDADDEDTNDVERITHADLSAPILVTHWRGRLVVLDGYHRLLKAKREGRAELPGKLIPEEWLLAARIVH
jgi:hypothetical protein